MYICFGLCMNIGYRSKTVMKQHRYVLKSTYIQMYVCIFKHMHVRMCGLRLCVLIQEHVCSFMAHQTPIFCRLAYWFAYRYIASSCLQYRYCCAPVRFIMFLVVVVCDESRKTMTVLTDINNINKHLRKNSTASNECISVHFHT